MALSAAFGTPSVITWEGFLALGGLNGYRLDLATKSVVRLRRAQASTIATLALVAVAVGLTWYGPRSASVILKVERRSLPTVCGKLVSSSDGTIDLKPLSSGPIRVDVNELISMKAVTECP
jgi:hypothetical protein